MFSFFLVVIFVPAQTAVKLNLNNVFSFESRLLKTVTTSNLGRRFPLDNAKPDKEKHIYIFISVLL